MSNKKLTQEERILLAINEYNGSCLIEELRKKLGMSDKSYRHTLRLLEHGNFIKTKDETIYMTSHGQSLCRSLQT